MKYLSVLVALAATLAHAADKTPLTLTGSAAGEVVIKVAAASGADPAAVGKQAAESLKTAFGQAPLKAVVLLDSFEDLARKQALLRGAASVIPAGRLFGGAAYGGFSQRGSLDNDGVVMLGLGGTGLTVSAALADAMGAAGLSLEKNQVQLQSALGRGGERLAQQLTGLAAAKLLVLIGDAHSPKNQLLIDGVQKVAGRKLPVTGGSVNKNAGQSWVYFRGAAYTDAAIALALSGPFAVTQAGRQAKANEQVIATAKEGAATALKAAKGKPLAVLAFNCAGRKGKLERLEDELEAIQASVGKEAPLFGAYCAGEFGPADVADGGGDGTSCGRGWHVMFTVVVAQPSRL